MDWLRSLEFKAVYTMGNFTYSYKNYFIKTTIFSFSKKVFVERPVYFVEISHNYGTRAISAYDLVK